MKGKSLAAMLVASSPKSEKTSDEPTPDTSDESMAAQDILDAIKVRDASALSEALESFIKICGSKEESSESDSETE